MPSGTTIMSYIEHIASISAAVAVIYTAWIGGRQLKTWTEDKLFDRRAKHAIRIINMLHEAKEVIHTARFPSRIGAKNKSAISFLKFYTKARYGNNEKLKKEKLKSRELLMVSNLYCMLREKRHIFDKISKYTPIAKFVFDSEIQSLLGDLVNVYRGLSRDAHRILIFLDEEKNRDKIDSLFLKNYKFMRGIECDENDEISEKVDSIIDQVETRIREIMGTKQ